MLETDAELAALQELLDRSLAGAGSHLTSIITPEHRLSAGQLVAELVGMKVLVLATTTASAEPRTSCVDGHFIHGSWVFTTAGSAWKAHHMAARPAVSATYADGERVAVFTHGDVELLNGTAAFGEYDAHLTAHYGASPSTWDVDIRYYRLAPSWMAAYAMDAAGFPEVSR